MVDAVFVQKVYTDREIKEKRREGGDAQMSSLVFICADSDMQPIRYL
jgi:hypothetical protein